MIAHKTIFDLTHGDIHLYRSYINRFLDTLVKSQKDSSWIDKCLDEECSFHIAQMSMPKYHAALFLKFIMDTFNDSYRLLYYPLYGEHILLYNGGIRLYFTGKRYQFVRMPKMTERYKDMNDFKYLSYSIMNLKREAFIDTTIFIH